MADKPGNQTPNTPGVSESELRDLKVEELRQEAQDAGVEGASDMRKDELVREVARVRSGPSDSSRGNGSGQGDLGAGPDGGHLRTGKDTSKSLKYSQEITSTEDEPERAGRSLATTHHEVIRRWAEDRGATPATVEGTEHGDHLGVLRFDFGDGNDKLRRVSWEEWFRTFDDRQLNFLYQEETTDGRKSNFFRLESPNREDA